MIWEKAQLRTVSLGEKDRLGNKKKTYGPPTDILIRMTQWTSEDVDLYGRELTKTSRKLLTPSKLISQNTIVVIDGKNHKIVNIMDLGRFRLAFIERYNYNEI